MPNQVVKALRTDVPGNSLAVWLAAHHPDLFLATYRQARAAQVAKGVQTKGLGRLADGETTTFAPSTDFVSDVTINTDSPPANILTDATPSGSSFLDSVGNGLTSVGSTIGGALGTAGSGLLSALGSVGSYLQSPAGQNGLLSLGKSIFTAQTAQANASMQQAVLQAQVARAATNQVAAPITYTVGANGQPVPVYATPTPHGTVYQPLSAQGIASLTPSAIAVFISRYGLWLALGGAALVGLTLMRR